MASVVSHKYGYEDARGFWSSAAYVTPGLTRGLPRVVPATRGATAGRPYRSSRLADNQNARASS